MKRPSYAVICVASLWLGVVTPDTGPAPVAIVSGRLTVMERNNKTATDVGQGVVWLEPPGGAVGGGGGGSARAPGPRSFDVITEGKDYRPRVSVVPVGSTVRFPNNDPFNHNVFSLSDEGQFDLGLYGRGEVKSARFTRPGLVRVYCNVHAKMAAFILVMGGVHYAQPSGDGSFSIPGVPSGNYVLRAWHERAAESKQEVEVTAQGLTGLDLQLDARGFKFVEHLNKFGQPYSRGGARY